MTVHKHLVAISKNTSVPTDPYQDWVTTLFHFNNNVTNTGAAATIPHTEAVDWNAFGTQAYMSKPNGGAFTYSTTSQFGSHSFNFGNARRIHFGNYDAFPMHTDFTWEAWVNITDLSVDNYIWGRGDVGSGTVGSYFKINTSGNGLVFWYQNNTIVSTSTASLIAINTWYHLAVTRSGNSWRVFVNGVQEGSTATNSIATIPGAQSVLGGDNTTSTTNYFRGLCDEFRFTRTVARYTSNFTPSTTSFPDYAAYPVVTAPDPNYSSVSGLWHFNGTNGAATYTDNGPNGLVMTRSNTIASMGVLSTATARYGSANLVLNSGYVVTGSGVILPSSSTPLNMGTGNFTVETWMCRNGNTKTAYLFSAGATAFEIKIQDTHGRIDVVNNGVTICSSVKTNTTEGYYHYCSVSRSNSTVYLHVDGLLEATGTSNAAVDLSGGFFGRRTSTDSTNSAGTGGTTFCGNIDDLRITKGVARYTSSDYIVPRGEHANS